MPIDQNPNPNSPQIVDKFESQFLAFQHPAMARRRKTSLASSCAVAAAFLLLAAGAGGATLFVLFRPRDPTVHVTAVDLPGFSVRNGSAIAFSFSENAAVRNPNRASFSHFDSSIRLLHGGAQVGFMYIPAGEIGGGLTQYMAATFTVPEFPVAAGGGGAGSVEVEVEARVELRGRVRVLRVFVHRVEVVERCVVAVRAADGAVIGVRC